MKMKVDVKGKQRELKDLYLVAIYLSSWEEKSRNQPEEKLLRAWKTYLYEIVDLLEKDRMLFQPRNSTSVVLTKRGIHRAEILRQKFKQVDPF